MNLTGIILQLISGGVGGNIAAALLKKLNLGPVGNSIAGIVGGLITGQVLRLLGSGVLRRRRLLRQLRPVGWISLLSCPTWAVLALAELR